MTTNTTIYYKSSLEAVEELLRIPEVGHTGPVGQVLVVVVDEPGVPVYLERLRSDTIHRKFCANIVVVVVVLVYW